MLAEDEQAVLYPLNNIYLFIQGSDNKRQLGNVIRTVNIYTANLPL